MGSHVVSILVEGPSKFGDSGGRVDHVGRKAAVAVGSYLMVVQNTRSKYPMNPCSLDLSVAENKNHREYPWFLPVGLLAVLIEVRSSANQGEYPVGSFLLFDWDVGLFTVPAEIRPSRSHSRKCKIRFGSILVCLGTSHRDQTHKNHRVLTPFDSCNSQTGND